MATETVPGRAAAIAQAHDTESVAKLLSSGCHDLAESGFNVWALLGAVIAKMDELGERSVDRCDSFDMLNELGEIGRVVLVARDLAHGIGSSAMELDRLQYRLRNEAAATAG